MYHNLLFAIHRRNARIALDDAMARLHLGALIVGDVTL